MQGSTRAYCTCRDPGGKRYRTGKCPQWNARGHKRWEFSVDLDKEYDASRGKHVRRQLRRGGFATRREAEAAMTTESHRILNHEAPTLAARQITLGEWLPGWMREQEQSGKWRPTTAHTYGSLARFYILPPLGHYRVGDLRPQHVRDLLDLMRTGALSPSRRPPGAQMVKMAHGLLQAALKQAVQERLITWNPAAMVSGGKVASREVTPWTVGQRDRFLALARERDPALYPGYFLTAHWGLRRGELAALTWADVDFKAGRLLVARTAWEAGGRSGTGEVKVRRSRRFVPLGPEVTAVLREHRKAQLAGTMPAGGDLVVPGEDGEIRKLWQMSAGFGRIAREAGLPGSFHSLRHTAACVMIRGGMRLTAVAAILGHTVDTLLDVYHHVIPDELAEFASVPELHQDSPPAGTVMPR